MPILSVKGLNWSVAGKALLCDINFQIPRGAMLGLIGPNGAGKSSLLRCLYRYIKPDNGHIMLDNVDIQSISSKALASKIAVVQQDTPAELDICVWDIVSMGLLPTKSWLEFDSTGDAQLIQNALAKVSLIEYAECPFNQLSGGERQRVLIARAIVQQPQLLILDEPTNHLDIRYQIQLLELVKSLKISVIASIHDLNLASSLCDKLLLLDQGHLIAQGSPQVILTEETIASVFGVCTKVQPHPQHGKPLITYFY